MESSMKEQEYEGPLLGRPGSAPGEPSLSPDSLQDSAEAPFWAPGSRLGSHSGQQV